VAIGYQQLTIADEAQRFEGYRRIGAADYVPHVSTRTLSLGLVTATSLVNASVEKAIADGERIAAAESAYRKMVLDNENGVRADCFMDPIGAGISVRFGGDSLTEQASGAPARRSSAVVALLFPSATILNVGVGGNTSTQINTNLSGRSSAEWGWTNFVNATTNDEATFTATASFPSSPGNGCLVLRLSAAG
jgi:hypothetical protein